MQTLPKFSISFHSEHPITNNYIPQNKRSIHRKLHTYKHTYTVPVDNKKLFLCLNQNTLCSNS